MIEETTQTSPETTSKKSLSPAQAILVGACIIGVALIIAFGKGDGMDTSEKLPKDTFSLVPGEVKDTEPPSLTFNPTDMDEHVLGDRNAEVFLIEYSDIDCPFCKKFHPTMHQLLTDSGIKVAWVYRHFPLESIHPDAFTKAKATECVAEIGGNDAFWTYLDTLFSEEVTPANLSAKAQAQGIDQDAFDECMAGTTIEEKVRADIESGMKAGVQGTPFTAVINVKTKEQATIPGALDYATALGVIEGVLN